MNGLIRQWGGQVKDNVAVEFPISYTNCAKVIISRVADADFDITGATNSVQPLPGESGDLIKTGFRPHFGEIQNSGHWLAVGF